MAARPLPFFVKRQGFRSPDPSRAPFARDALCPLILLCSPWRWTAETVASVATPAPRRGREVVCVFAAASAVPGIVPTRQIRAECVEDADRRTKSLGTLALPHATSPDGLSGPSSSH